MSVSYAARSLIGVCLTHDEIFRPTKCKAFAHDYPESMKYDPETGKKLWETWPKCILTDATDFETSCVEPHPELGGLYLFHDSSGARPDPEVRYLLGSLATEGSDGDGIGHSRHMDFFIRLTGTIDLDAIRGKIRTVLEPHGLWKPGRFGIWTVLYVGC